MKKIVIVLLYCFCFAGAFADPGAFAAPAQQKQFIPDFTNNNFRMEIIQYVRMLVNKLTIPQLTTSLNDLDTKLNNHYQHSNWTVHLSLYSQGEIIGEGDGQDESITKSLQSATENVISEVDTEKLTAKLIKNSRFKIEFLYYPSNRYAFIEYKNQGLELTGSRVAVRELTREAIKTQLQASEGYILRVMHPDLHGFYKFYYPDRDEHENLLRTIYSSSSLYTLMKLNAWKGDNHLEPYFKPIADFILSKQLQEGRYKGAFYYGYDLDQGKNMEYLSVGTTSKTIFTLLELNKFYPKDPQYLNAAKQAGNWLLTMIKPDGRVIPLIKMKNGNWEEHPKQSLLFSGQVLSALSRLYAQTQDKRYLQGASQIANLFMQRVKAQGAILGDDFRPANSISSSWVMMSLIDYAKVYPLNEALTDINQIAKALLARQIKSSDDIFNNGRYSDAMTTSGNGWVNEVMGVFYDFCNVKQMGQCEDYHQAMILTSRWLLQNAYTEQNTYDVKNPQQAIGGFLLGFNTPKVRTDAVCHGVNSFLSLLQETPTQAPEPLLSLPERPLQEILPLLRAGYP